MILKQECWTAPIIGAGIAQLPAFTRPYRIVSAYGFAVPVPPGAAELMSMTLEVFDGNRNAIGAYFADVNTLGAGGVQWTIADGLSFGSTPNATTITTGPQATGPLSHSLWINEAWIVLFNFAAPTTTFSQIDPVRVVVEYPWP